MKIVGLPNIFHNTQGYAFTLTNLNMQLLSLTDLEFDYINPYDTAIRINKAVIP